MLLLLFHYYIHYNTIQMNYNKFILIQSVNLYGKCVIGVRITNPTNLKNFFEHLKSNKKLLTQFHCNSIRYFGITIVKLDKTRILGSGNVL